MKKILKFLSVNFLSLVFFTGCYDPVFDDIRKEVPLEDSEISGYINDLTRFRSVYDSVLKDGTVQQKEAEFLVLQNGIIYAKQISPDSDLTDLSYGESHGKWFKTGSGISPLSYDYYGEKFNGEYIVKTASEFNGTKSTVYALSTKWGKNDDYGRNIPTEFKLYSMDKINGTWSPLATANQYLKNCFATGIDSNYGTDVIIQLFCTNTPKVENRRAFLRLGGEKDKWFNAVDENGNPIEVECIIFELSDSVLTPIYYSKRTKQSDSSYLKEIYKNPSLSSSKPETLSSKTVSAVEMQGEVYFLPFIGSTGNSTPSSDGTFICYGSGTNAYYFTKADYEALDGQFAAKKIVNGKETEETEQINAIVAFWTGRKGSDGNAAEKPSQLKEVGLSTNKDIISASASKDDILFGTRGNGVFRALIKEDGSIEKTNDFVSNAASIMASPYIIRMIFTVDPSKDGKTTSRYSAMDFIYTASNAGANDSHRGLWSYYKGRGNWNRE